MSVVYHGERFAGYRLVGLVGCSALTTVHHALDSDGRTVALKIFNSRLDESVCQRLVRDSAVARDLDHPHIVPVHEAAEAGGRMFIAMRLVTGGDLASILASSERLDPGRTLALLTGVAAALDAAHARGLVHGDLKPSNILVQSTDGDERAYLTDFGRWNDDPEYMAPEQIGGGAVDARTDVYSLGLILHRCLAMAAPITRARSSARPSPTPAPLSSLDPRRFSDGLDEVVARALATRGEQRYPTATAFLAAARRAIAEPGYDDPAAAALDHRPGPRRGPRRWSPMVVATLSATILAAASAVAVGVHRGHDAGASTPAAASAPALLAPGVTAIAPSPSATRAPSPSAVTAPPRAPTRGVVTTTAPAAPTAHAPQPGTPVNPPLSGATALLTATVRNTGTTELVAGTGRVSDTAAAAIVQDGCTGVHLSPGGSCLVTVRVLASALRAGTTTLSVPLSDGGPVTIPLRGPGG